MHRFFYRDHDFSPVTTVFKIAHRFRHFTQGIGSVDDGGMGCVNAGDLDLLKLGELNGKCSNPATGPIDQDFVPGRQLFGRTKPCIARPPD